MYPIILQEKFIGADAMPRPQRIISLEPSQTELLASLGLYERVVGITKYCTHPAYWQAEKEIIGGNKKIDIEKIRALQPDLIIANKEENVKEQVEALAGICPVYVSNVHSLNTALEMILQVGILIGSLLQAESLVHEIVLAFEVLEKQVQLTPTKARVAYLIWRKPYMAAGENTFISNMLHHCGWQNVYSNIERYPTITIEELKQASPDWIFLSSEPFPFTQSHIEELSKHLPHTKMLLVNGDMFSWYGSRLLKAPAYFSTVIQQYQ